MRRSASSYSDCQVVGTSLVFIEISESQGGFGWSFRYNETQGSGKFEGSRIGDAYDCAVDAARASQIQAPKSEKFLGQLIVEQLRNGEANVLEVGGATKSGAKAVASSYREVGHFPDKFEAWRFIEEQRSAQ